MAFALEQSLAATKDLFRVLDWREVEKLLRPEIKQTTSPDKVWPDDLRVQIQKLKRKTRPTTKKRPVKSRFVKYSTSPTACQPKSGLMGFVERGKGWGKEVRPEGIEPPT